MQVKITRKLGHNAPGTEIDVTPTEAEWLRGHGYAESITDQGDSVTDQGDDQGDTKGKATTPKR